MNKKTNFTSIRRIMAIIAIAYVALVVISYFYYRIHLFEKPQASYKDTPQIIKLETKNGVRISAIYLPNPKAYYTLLYSHNNRTDLGRILPLLEAFQQHGFAVFAYDYQGFGTSGGEASAEHATADSEAAYNYLTQFLGIYPKKIIAFGKGVGAGVALDLVMNHPVGGIILESPFISAFSKISGVTWLPFDPFNNLKKVRQLKYPVLIIHGEKDKVVPFWHAQKLFENITAPKFSLWIPNAGHEGLLTAAPNVYWQAVDNFTTQVTKMQEKK
ncbi:MAG: alpha/beta hydrolase [Gammaproteobacteria bacterium]